jgi:hypothetical protein
VATGVPVRRRPGVAHRGGAAHTARSRPGPGGGRRSHRRPAGHASDKFESPGRLVTRTVALAAGRAPGRNNLKAAAHWQAAAGARPGGTGRSLTVAAASLGLAQAARPLSGLSPSPGPGPDRGPQAHWQSHQADRR